MDIHLELIDLLEAKGLLHIGDIESISGTIGIDGDAWLKSILPEDIKSSVMGSISMALRPTILNYFKHLSSFSLSPVVILPGIELFSSPTPSYSDIWENIAEGKNIIEQKPEKNLNSETLHSVFDIIKLYNGEVFRAPYLPAAQLAYLKTSGLIQHVYGLADLIFYDVPVVIIEIMLTKYKYINTQEILDYFLLTSSQFMQAFVLKGFLGHKASDMPLSLLLETIKYVGPETISQDQASFKQCCDILESKVSLGHSPAKLVYTNSEQAKSLGLKLPVSLMHAMALLNISTELLGSLSKGKQFEKAPIASSDNYRKVLRSLKDIKSTTFGILSTFLNEAYFKNQIRIHYWYSEINEILAVKPVSFINWNINPMMLHKALKLQQKKIPDLQFCLQTHFMDYESNKELLSSSDEANLINLNCMLTRIYFNFLEAIGYIHSTGKPTLFGKSFMSCDPELQSSIFYLQETLKLGVLNGRTLSQALYCRITAGNFEKLCGMHTDDKSRHAIVLISRVFSLVQPTLDEKVWEGEVDYDLAQFHSILKAVFSSYNQLFEAFVLREVYLNGVSDEVIEVSKKSPLFPFPNPALGVAIKKLLLYDDVERVTAEMPHMADLFLDLNRGWILWKNFVRIMNIFQQHNATNVAKFVDEIKFASKKLKTILEKAKVDCSY